ncbi:MAG: diacylglycerol kinase family lipid kinase [Gemmatimonadetes bacterium]|nr:diacylglycerol kinase family lipid kinase [Gemmatimonadota bacterium]
MAETATARLPIDSTAHPWADRTLVILNPAAGQDDPARLRRLIGGAFAARGASFDLALTERPGHADELVRRGARLGYRAVCVAGGDGTIAEAAAGLSGTEIPLAIIPRGTANQVAQNLRIPGDVEEAVEVALNGDVTSVDLGYVGERAFALVAGAGFDAAVMASATREMKEKWGFGAYIFAAVKEALTAQPRRFRIRADDRDLEVDAVSVLIANVGELFSQFIPFRISLAPQPTNSWQDGRFEVVVLAPRNPPEFATVLWRAAHRKFGGDDRLIHFQAQEISIEADPAIAVQIDGDPAGTTPVRAIAVPRAMRVLVPAGRG